MEASPEQLRSLFPHPPSEAELLSASSPVPRPRRQAGWTHESTETVLKLLRDNHHRFHIFFNDKGFHNHASHHLLAIYAMGANSQLLEGAYGTHVVYQRPAFPPPESQKISTVIDDTNWKDHLGDERYYQAYVAFFSGQLTTSNSSIADVVQKHVTSKDANVIPGKSGVVPHMLSRFLSGFLHPLIHVGYGAEFSLPGLVSEGIAQAAAQPAEAVDVFPEALFEGLGTSSLTSKLASLVIDAKPPSTGIHALTILSRIAKDPDFAPSALGLPLPPDAPVHLTDVVIKRQGPKLLGLVEEWARDLTADISAEALRAKFEEVVWANTVAYGVPGWTGRTQGKDETGRYNADFLMMHLVTSALLMPSLLNTLSRGSAALLLRTYFAFSLVVFVARGRPQLSISSFYRATTARPEGPTKAPESAKDTLAPKNTPNPWLPIIQTTLVHPNEHLCKLQRALLHFAELYGGTPKGHFANLASELDGAETLDGTLFIRVAGMTADRLGWMREGQEQREWDFAAFYKDEFSE